MLLGKVWRRTRLDGVSWSGVTGGEGRQASRAGGGLAVEEDHSNEDRGGLGVLRGRLAGDFVSRGSLWKASLHISAAPPVSNLAPRPRV